MNTILKLKVTLLLLTIILLPACNKQSKDVNQILNTSTAYIFNEMTRTNSFQCR